MILPHAPSLRHYESACLPVLLLSCIGFSSGCVEAPPHTVQVGISRPSEPAWEDQLRQLEAGTSSEIRLTSQPVSPQQWQRLQQEGRVLEVLEVDASGLDATDLTVLADLQQLRRLKLTGPVGDAALQQIAAAGSLSALNLPDGVFTDEGLRHLESLQNLELLRFGSPNVTDDGLAVLPRLPSLRFLHLINVPVTDEGLKHLHGLTGLESFYLDGGRCTDEGLYTLLNALPHLHFHRDQLHLPEDPHAHPHTDTDGSSGRSR